MTGKWEWKYLVWIVCWLIWATPVLGQDRGLPLAATSPEPGIPSAHVATTTPSQIPAANQGQHLDGEFPLLKSEDETLDSKMESSGFATPLVTVVSSLAIVLGLFAGLVFLTRKFGGTVRAGSVPSDVLQTLGSTALDARTRVTMLRCGSRIVVAAQTASGIHPLCEITDPLEVHELTVACTGQSQASFAETLKAAQQKHTQTAPVARRSRLFATG